MREDSDWKIEQSLPLGRCAVPPRLVTLKGPPSEHFVKEGS